MHTEDRVALAAFLVPPLVGVPLIIYGRSASEPVAFFTGCGLTAVPVVILIGLLLVALYHMRNYWFLVVWPLMIPLIILMAPFAFLVIHLREWFVRRPRND